MRGRGYSETFEQHSSGKKQRFAIAVLVNVLHGVRCEPDPDGVLAENLKTPGLLLSPLGAQRAALRILLIGDPG